jgi:hypothetical protein
VAIERSCARFIFLVALIFSELLSMPHADAQSLTMDGESGIFLQPVAGVVPAPQHKFAGPTFSFHAVDAGSIAGVYINFGVEEGYGNWLEFGYTRAQHTNGGDPAISPLFNFTGMNIFNFKSKLLNENDHGHKYLPAISLGGVLRTNDPYVVQAVMHQNATNGDVYVVGTKLFVFGKKFAFSANGGVRGTNAQKYGYGGNTVDWEARAFGSLAFPIPIKKRVVVAPAVEVDQEPRRIKYIPVASFPTDLIYAIRLAHLPDSKWSFDIGTGHLGANIAPGINIKVNQAVAFAANYRF